MSGRIKPGDPLTCSTSDCTVVVGRYGSRYRRGESQYWHVYSTPLAAQPYEGRCTAHALRRVTA